jgi:hypothetical protein
MGVTLAGSAGALNCGQAIVLAYGMQTLPLDLLTNT